MTPYVRQTNDAASQGQTGPFCVCSNTVVDLKQQQDYRSDNNAQEVSLSNILRELIFQFKYYIQDQVSVFVTVSL